MATKRALTASGVLALAFLAQLSGHLLLKYYMPNPAVGGAGLVLTGLIFWFVLHYRRDVFGFVMVVYVCSHFSYADQQGGLWNLIAFGVGASYLAMGGWKGELRRPDPLMAILFTIFILWNVAGWIAMNPMPIVPLLQGAAAFFGLIITFRLTSTTEMTPARMRLFLTLTFVMLGCQVLATLNQRYGLLDLNTPLLGIYSEYGSSLKRVSVSSPGTLTNFELLGEYCLLTICLLMPLLSSSRAEKELNFGSNRIVMMILMCLACIVLARNRSSAILTVLAVATFYILFAFRPFVSIDRFGRQVKLVLALAVITPLTASLIGLQSLQDKFAEIEGEDLTLESVISGKSINRGLLISMGKTALESRSWLVGHGYGTPRSNRWAWFGMDPEWRFIPLADFHSLYLSLPMLFGWVGSAAFLAIIVVTWFRAIGVSLQYRKRASYLLAISAGLSMMWFVLLANEYKIILLRNPNYTMLFWIWLGLSLSVIRTARNLYTAKAPEPQRPAIAGRATSR